MNTTNEPAMPDGYWALFNQSREYKAGPQRKPLNDELRKMRTAAIADLARRHCIDLVQDGGSGTPWHAWFWFNHFNVYAPKLHVGVVLESYLKEAITGHLNGRFVDLLKAVSLHPAMLMYLDNARNIKGQGNENQARELLELHTLGVSGGYTQGDVSATAKVMTGWGVQLNGAAQTLGQTVFHPGRHEGQAKQVLGQTLKASGADEFPALLEILAAHPATARHVARRLCQWWFADEPPAAAVDRLVQVYAQTQGSLPALWAQAKALRDEAAASRGAIGSGKFKDPLRYVTSAVRLLADGAPLSNAEPVLHWLRLLGQPMFGRSTPDGYPLAGSSWISAGQLAQRVELARDMVATVPRLLQRDNAARRRLPLLPATRRATVPQADDPAEAWALWLASPEFMVL
jgi:uncharacterized protein (DUF1800 family)